MTDRELQNERPARIPTGLSSIFLCTLLRRVNAAKLLAAPSLAQILHRELLPRLRVLLGNFIQAAT